MWPFNAASAISPIQKPTPKPNWKYRVVRNPEGKFLAQVWGSMYGNAPKWLTIGDATIDHPSEAKNDNYLTHWLYPDDKFAFDKPEEAEKIIPRYVAAQAKKYGDDLIEIQVYK